MATVSIPQVEPVREASRRLVRELGFLRATLAGTELPASAVHALLEIDARGTMTAGELASVLALEKSSVSRMLRKLLDKGQVAEVPERPDGRTKPISLTPGGRTTVDAIHGYARRQVTAALGRLGRGQRQTVVDGLRLYANALAAGRAAAEPAVAVEFGYRPGALARCAEMHARYYARTAGFGRPFEALVASGLAEFSERLDRPGNEIGRAHV